MDTALNVRALLQIAWRRKWFFLIPATLLFSIAIAAIIFWPPLYKSRATLIIEQKDIPEDFVPSIVTDRIERRLEVITREVLGTENLRRIADRFDLYAGERDMLSGGEIASLMRQRFDMETLLTEFTDPRSGRRGQVTLGFEISFLDADSRKARQITNELVSIYMANSTEIRRDIASQTANFLSAERESIDERIANIEDDITQFINENRETVPREAALKRQLVNNVDQRLRSLESDLRVLRERESYLSTQLALIDEFESPRGGGQTPESRLELLRAELATARARYNSSHPDVVRLEREVASLESVVSERAGSTAVSQQEAALTAELAALRERYTPAHPDVQRVQRELDAVRQLVAGDDGAGQAVFSASRTSSFVRLSAQLNSVQAEITAVEEQQTRLEEERVVLQEQLAVAPEVEREYKRLQRQLDNALADREALAGKEATAKLSSAVETTASSERLVLIESPTQPSSPYSPNRKLILALGFVLATGMGGASALIAELLDRSVREASHLARILGDAPLATVPVIATVADRRRTWCWRIGTVMVVVLAVSGSLTWVHHRIAPLDLLGYQAVNEAERWMATLFPGANDRERE